MDFLVHHTLEGLPHFISCQVSWWRDIPSPIQMRQEPMLCESPYKHLRPIFEADGCQLPQYMHKEAPRCQSRYLQWICAQSRIEKNDSSSNGFFLREAHHAILHPHPPTPFLITAKKSFITMCGQILHPCGLVHLANSCLAQYQRDQARLISRTCFTKSVDFSPPVTYDGIFKCSSETPFSNEVNGFISFPGIFTLGSWISNDELPF